MTIQSIMMDTVQTLYNAVKTKSANAVPEELAYLATAIEKLSGPMTTMEMIDLAEKLKTDMSDHKTNEVGSFNLLVAASLEAIQTQLTSLQATYTATMSQAVANQTANFTSTVTTLKNAAIGEVQTKINEANAAKADLDTARLAAKADTDNITKAITNAMGAVYFN